MIESRKCKYCLRPFRTSRLEGPTQRKFCAAPCRLAWDYDRRRRIINAQLEPAEREARELKQRTKQDRLEELKHTGSKRGRWIFIPRGSSEAYIARVKQQAKEDRPARSRRQRNEKSTASLDDLGI